jgi:D-alanine-D-alanine ligase
VTIGVLFGGPTPEHDISILTGLLAFRELQNTHKDALGIYWTKTGRFFSVPANAEAESFLEGLPKGSSELSLRVGDQGGFFATGGRMGKDRRLDIEALILATHGGPGEDGSLQAALDLANVSYSGPSVAGAALGMDKWAFGAVIANAGLPTLARVLLTGETPSLPFEGPYILKPRFGGSSIGIDVVADLATAKARLSANVHLSRGCVVEPFRQDLTDVQIALRTYPTLSLSSIEKPIRRSDDAEILDYRDKYVGGEGMVSAPRELPAVLPAGQREAIEEGARIIAGLASVRGVARIDFLANDTELFVNEINTIPGSLSKHLFVQPALPFSQLLADLVAEAIERPAHRYSAAGADGLVLRSATSIASKLA